jgi:hypothetical protein
MRGANHSVFSKHVMLTKSSSAKLYLLLRLFDFCCHGVFAHGFNHSITKFINYFISSVEGPRHLWPVVERASLRQEAICSFGNVALHT